MIEFKKLGKVWKFSEGSDYERERESLPRVLTTREFSKSSNRERERERKFPKMFLDRYFVWQVSSDSQAGPSASKKNEGGK